MAVDSAGSAASSALAVTSSRIRWFSSLSASPRVYGKAAFIWNKNGEEISDEFMETLDHTKKELNRRGIEVTYDENETGCNMGIIFVTKEFLVKRKRDLLGFRQIFGGWNCSVVICDDNDRKFDTYVRNAISPEYDGTDDGYLTEHGLTPDAVNWTLGIFMRYSNPKYRTITPGLSCAEMRTFAVKFAEEAVQTFNPMSLDYSKLDKKFESDILDIYKKLINKRKQISKGRDDFLFAFFAGCRCNCFDMTVITKLVGNLKFLTPFKFYFTYHLSKEKCNSFGDNNPFALQQALALAKYRRPNELNQYVQWHLEDGPSPKYFIFIHDFDVSKPNAQEQLKNLAFMLGRGSLVIITTSTSTESLMEMDFLTTVDGTTCSRDTGLTAKCYTLLKSKLIESRKEDGCGRVCPRKDNMDINIDSVNLTSNVEPVWESGRKRPKTISV